MSGKSSRELRRDLDLGLQDSQTLETIGPMTGRIVHDIDNLLIGILGYTDLALAQIDDHSAVRDCLENIRTTTLRATDLAASQPGVQLPAANEPSNATKGTLLVVDDEAIVRISTKALAETAGYVVLTAENGHDALEVYRHNHSEIDCVILDMTMPKLGGLETLVELRRINASVRVLLTSGGYLNVSFKDHPGSNNVVGFLQKPYDFSELLEKLQGAVGSPMDV